MKSRTSSDPTELTFFEFVRERFRFRNLVFLFLGLTGVQLLILSIFFSGKCGFVSSLLGRCSPNYYTSINIQDIQLKDIFSESGLTPGPEDLPICPLVPPNLKGHVKVRTQIFSWARIKARHANLQPGGRHKPENCTARHRVAIIVPFRDRDMHLKVFINNIHSFLQKQQLDYGIYIVDLAPEVGFNRAMLMNIGFVEALKIYNYQCFVFHDVDLIPEFDLNMYSCPENPRHMSTAIDKFGYRLPYTNIFGGVVAMTKEQFEMVNGFSNKFFGWGGEDDDMSNRIRINGLSITRYTTEVARYKMLSHAKEKPNPARFSLIEIGRQRFNEDGINSLKYKQLKLEFRKLYTYIQVYINETEILQNETEVLRNFTITNSKKRTNPSKIIDIFNNKIVNPNKFPNSNKNMNFNKNLNFNKITNSPKNMNFNKNLNFNKIKNPPGNINFEKSVNLNKFLNFHKMPNFNKVVNSDRKNNPS